MPAIDRLYTWMRTGPAPDCDRMLAAALHDAESPWFERMVDVLLARDTSDSWAALIGVGPRLAPAARAKLDSDQHKFQDAIAIACEAPIADARLNALRALEQAPCARIAHVLPGVLRDSVPAQRAAAAATLRAISDKLLQAWVDAEDLEDTAAPNPSDRRTLASAAQECVRTFDLHHRVEALEVGLWLAAEIGPPLWEILNNHRSRAGIVISEHLPQWNSPRLAGFLLLALRHSAWRQTALALLQEWNQPRQVVELLRNTALLNDPQIRMHIAAIRGRPWLAPLGENLRNVPRKLRVNAARWASAVGLKDDERLAILARWTKATDEGLQRHATYALAALDSKEARRELRVLSESRSPLARFAAWVVCGAESRAARVAPRNEIDRKAEQRRAEFTPPPEEPRSDSSFSVLWQTCRRASGEQRAALVETIRDQAEPWRNHLRRLLRSADARDRLMVLQTVSTPELLRRFRRDIEGLLDDPIEPVRKLATAVLHGVGAPGGAADARATAAVAGEFDESAAQESNDSPISAELRELLDRLSSDPSAASDPLVIARVRTLLREARQASSAVAGSAT